MVVQLHIGLYFEFKKETWLVLKKDKKIEVVYSVQL